MELADGQTREGKGSKHIVHEGEEEAGSFLSFSALRWNAHVQNLLLYTCPWHLLNLDILWKRTQVHRALKCSGPKQNASWHPRLKQKPSSPNSGPEPPLLEPTAGKAYSEGQPFLVSLFGPHQPTSYCLQLSLYPVVLLTNVIHPRKNYKYLWI